MHFLFRYGQSGPYSSRCEVGTCTGHPHFLVYLVLLKYGKMIISKLFNISRLLLLFMTFGAFSHHILLATQVMLVMYRVRTLILNVMTWFASLLTDSLGASIEDGANH